AIEPKLVEEKFERTGRILHLHLLGGELIRTTPEHPFFVDGKGWTAAGALAEGDRIRADSGWVGIEEVFDTGCYETVYNLRVADWHTYFVGDEGWGRAVWAHNQYIAHKKGNPASNRTVFPTGSYRDVKGDSGSTYNRVWFVPKGTNPNS